jgi:hypothetical protein
MIERGKNYSVRIFMNSHQPIPKASISKLFGDANISNGHRIVDIPEIPKWTIPATSNRSSICCVTAAALT